MMQCARRSLPWEEMFRAIESSFDFTTDEELERDICLTNIPGEAPAITPTVRTICPANEDICHREARGPFQNDIARLSALLDESCVAAFMIDCDCEVVIWNRACEILTLIPKEDVLGAPLNASSPFDNNALPLPSLAGLLLQTNGAGISEYSEKGILKYDPCLEIIECKGLFMIDGERRTLRINASKMRDRTGNTVGALQYAQDDNREEEAPTFLWINDA